MTKIAVVVGSVRQGRQSSVIAGWVAKEAAKLPEASVEILELADYPLPFMEEPMSPRFNPERKPEPAVKKWLDQMATFDCYVLVTPEYNRGTSGVLKNALDHLDYQMNKKPVALVGHGSTGGAQAVANLRMVLPGVGAISIPPAVFVDGSLASHIKDGVLEEELATQPYGPQTQLTAQLKELDWFARALKSASD